LRTRTHKTEHFKITKLKKTHNHKTNTFTYNITYETATQITPRTAAISEAFGLGIDQTQKFTIYDNIKLKISPTDIVYITGDSGSGKSILLKAIKQDLRKQATDMMDLTINQEKPIIDTVGETFNQALELLSKVGLNDAFLFLRQYQQLSDGQKYRYRLAKLIESDKQWWMADEFCSTLDRDTAKIVAFNLQKLVRQMGRAVIAATTHKDLFEDLKPSIHIHKRFGKEITINYHPNTPATECSLIKEMRIEKGNTADYKQLSHFHYRSSFCPAPRTIFTLKREDELCGVIVYSYPPPITFGRSKVWKAGFSQLQREMSTISRVIVHPKYRTMGLGVKLVRETLARAGTSCVETLAVMAKYNPFFERAGMRKIAESLSSQNLLDAVGQLCVLGFNSSMLGSVNQNLQEIRHVGKAKVFKVLEELSRREGSVRKRLMASGKVYPRHDEFVEKMHGFDEEGLAVVLKRLAFLAQTKVYLFWRRF
jgi:ABC-type ATPase with predicted acetyltransferase domain